MSALLLSSPWLQNSASNKQWGTSVITVGLLHVLVIGFILYKPIDRTPVQKSPEEGAISLELAPELASSQSALSSQQMDKANQQSTPAPVKTLTPPAQEKVADIPAPEVKKSAITVPVEPKKPVPAVKKRKQPRMSRKPVPAPETPRKTQAQTSAQAANTAVKRTVASAPVAGSSQTASMAKNSWQNQVMAQLQKEKRYPAYAIRQNQQDVVLVSFTIDRSGNVLKYRIVNSQGFELLDREAKNLIERASPLPPPPASVPGSTIEMEVPIVFFLNK